jgi:hypothetical protein
LNFEIGRVVGIRACWSKSKEVAGAVLGTVCARLCVDFLYVGEV